MVDKIKSLEGADAGAQSTNRFPEIFTFSIHTSPSLHNYSSQSEWVVDFWCAHHMAKDASLLYSLSGGQEKKVYVVDDYSLEIVGCGDVQCRRGRITDVFHVPSLSENLMSVTHITSNGKTVKFWSD